MQYRPDRRTGTELSVLGFGCMRFPRTLGIIDMKKTEQLVMNAIKAGVNYFDTAYLYPGSEMALGTILKKHQVRSQVMVATKLPIGNCKERTDFDRIFTEQLERLKTDYIDFYLIHNVNSLSQWEGLCQLGIEQWIASQKAKGRIRRMGFSFHGACEEFLKLLGVYDWDFCQIQYNYSDENYQAGVKGLKRAGEKNIPVIIMEPLLGGKLVTGLPKRAMAVFRKVSPERSMASWGLRWLLDQPEVTVILSGMNREEQVQDNLQTAEESRPQMLTQKERKAYERVIALFRETHRVPCTGCGYCMPCPANVNIPGCFSAYNTSFSMDQFTGMLQYILGCALMTRDDHGAGRCVECGACQKNCPQHIAVPEQLKAVKKRMEPFYVRMVLAMVRHVRR